MGLLAPWFLAGAVAIGLPVWLHLLRRRHSPPRDFSSLMLFERRTESSVRQRRLRYWLLLTLRCLVLAALALAFARPYLERATAVGGGRRRVVLALDDSFSMRQGDRMRRAKTQALEQLNRVGPRERVQVIAFSAGVRVLGDADGDPAAARAAIQSLEATDSHGSYGELVRALRTLAQAAREPVEAHLFTDLQASALPATVNDLALPPGVRLHLHPVAEQAADNWSVEAVKAPACVYRQGPLRIEATVAGFSSQAAQRRVTVWIGGRMVDSREATTPARGRTTVEFTLPELRHGVHRGEVRIEPPDAFPDDDRRLFAIERADPHPALFVHEARDRRSPLYFRTALEASPENAFRLQEVAAEQAAGLLPDSYAFIVLSDVGWLPEPFASRLRAYLENGGAVWVAVGPSVLARGRTPLLGSRATANGEQGSGILGVWELDTTHPALQGTGTWQGVKFYRAAHIETGDARVLARLADQTPLLLEKTVGAGRLLIFASTFDNLSNDLPLHPCFVPFVVRSAMWLGGLEEKTASLTVDAHLLLRTPSERGTAVEVIGPDGRRALSLAEATTAEHVRLNRAGYYEVRRGSGRSTTVAANPDPRESDLTLMPAEVLELWRGAGSASEDATTQGTAQQSKRGLWQWVLLAALVVAAAESVVANRRLAGESEGL